MPFSKLFKNLFVKIYAKTNAKTLMFSIGIYLEVKCIDMRRVTYSMLSNFIFSLKKFNFTD